MKKKAMIRMQSIFTLLFVFNCALQAQMNIEKWKVFEVTLKAGIAGNPFTDVQLAGKFIHSGDTITVAGFYDGDGVYKIRFMPQKEGSWNYTTTSNNKTLNNKKGKFTCTPAAGNNHGPVKVKD